MGIRAAWQSDTFLSCSRNTFLNTNIVENTIYIRVLSKESRVSPPHHANGSNLPIVYALWFKFSCIYNKRKRAPNAILTDESHEEHIYVEGPSYSVLALSLFLLCEVCITLWWIYLWWIYCRSLRAIPYRHMRQKIV